MPEKKFSQLNPSILQKNNPILPMRFMAVEEKFEEVSYEGYKSHGSYNSRRE